VEGDFPEEQPGAAKYSGLKQRHGFVSAWDGAERFGKESQL
jgi:hypothetical protein